MVNPVRVVWLTLAPDTIARGYWDQGMLESIFARDLWRVPGGYEFEHVELVCPTDDALWAAVEPGGILVLPARHHADKVLARRVWWAVRRMSWCLLILTGDEEGEFDAERFLGVQHARAWVMTPQPGREYGERAFLFGTGWPPGIRAACAGIADIVGADQVYAPDRPWMFAGQVTHARREECAEMLRARPDRDLALLEETPGFTQGIDQRVYWLEMTNAKIAPAPSGPCSPDSFRCFEALEAGCVPIADDVTPDGTVHGFWARLFGAVPFPVADNAWAAQSATIDQFLADWPRSANRVFSWWQRQKRLMAWRLHDDVAALTGHRPEPGVDGSVSALIVTSPSPLHPDTAHLETTVESIRAQIPDAEIVLVFDGVRPELAHRAADYAEYTRRALWLANTRWHNVVPLVLDDWHHQAGAVRIGLDEVRSPYVVLVEHDTPLAGAIDWPGIVTALDGNTLDVVRLHHETAIGEHHAHMMLDHGQVTDGPIPFVRTYQWSQRPHVARVGWYRRLLELHFAPEARAMIEDALHGVVATAWLDHGESGWERFRVGIYAPEGNIQRSLHLDSRRRVVGEESTGDPKGKMLFAYPGPTPPGAPQPGWR